MVSAIPRGTLGNSWCAPKWGRVRSALMGFAARKHQARAFPNAVNYGERARLDDSRFKSEPHPAGNVMCSLDIGFAHCHGGGVLASKVFAPGRKSYST